MTPAHHLQDMKISRGFVLGLTLAAISVQSQLQSAATFTRIITQSDPLPDDPGRQAVLITYPVLDEASPGNTILVRLDASFDPGGFQALYLVDAANRFQRVVSTETVKPGGGTFTSFYYHAVHNGVVYFVAELGQMICKVDQPGGPVTLIAQKGDPAAVSNTFDAFSTLSAYAGGAVFDASVKRSDDTYYRDVFHFAGGQLTALIGYGITPVPGAPGYLYYMNKSTAPVVRDGEILFRGEGVSLFGISGIYTVPVPGSGKSSRVIADSTMKPSGLNVTYTFPESGASDLDSGAAVFYATSFGNTARGLYRNTPGAGTVVAVNGSTPVPGGAGNFNSASLAAPFIGLSGGKMVFRGSDTNSNSGIYLDDGHTLEKVVADGDEIGGVQVYSFELSRDGFAGNQLVFQAGAALWRATLGGSTPVVSLQVSITGTNVAVSWDGAAAGAGAILESTDSLTAANWLPVTSQSNPFPASTQSEAARYFRLKY